MALIRRQATGTTRYGIAREAFHALPALGHAMCVPRSATAGSAYDRNRAETQYSDANHSRANHPHVDMLWYDGDPRLRFIEAGRRSSSRASRRLRDYHRASAISFFSFASDPGRHSAVTAAFALRALASTFAFGCHHRPVVRSRGAACRREAIRRHGRTLRQARIRLVEGLCERPMVAHMRHYASMRSSFLRSATQAGTVLSLRRAIVVDGAAFQLKYRGAYFGSMSAALGAFTMSRRRSLVSRCIFRDSLWLLGKLPQRKSR